MKCPMIGPRSAYQLGLRSLGLMCSPFYSRVTDGDFKLRQIPEYASRPLEGLGFALGLIHGLIPGIRMIGVYNCWPEIKIPKPPQLSALGILRGTFSPEEKIIRLAQHDFDTEVSQNAVSQLSKTYVERQYFFELGSNAAKADYYERSEIRRHLQFVNEQREQLIVSSKEGSALYHDRYLQLKTAQGTSDPEASIKAALEELGIPDLMELYAKADPPISPYAWQTAPTGTQSLPPSKPDPNISLSNTPAKSSGR